MTDNIRKRAFDPKYLESIRRRFNRLYSEYGEITAENAMKIITFNNNAWNSFGNSARFHFGHRLEIH